MLRIVHDVEVCIFKNMPPRFKFKWQFINGFKTQTIQSFRVLNPYQWSYIRIHNVSIKERFLLPNTMFNTLIQFCSWEDLWNTIMIWTIFAWNTIMIRTTVAWIHEMLLIYSTDIYMCMIFYCLYIEYIYVGFHFYFIYCKSTFCLFKQT